MPYRMNKSDSIVRDERSYTLTKIEQLARQWSAEPTTSDSVSRIEEDLSIGLTLSLFLAWLKRREKEESSDSVSS